ncbi:MAG TPA: PHP domain-containing protein [Trichocoleus sp.]
MVVSPVQVSVPTPGVFKETEVLKAIFATIDEASCPASYNFHMHTVCSDGRLTPQGLMEQAFDLGLKGFAITDHHTVEGYRQAKQWLEDWRWRHPARFKGGNQGTASLHGKMPHLFVGIEITSLLIETEVHILGYSFNPNHPAMLPYLQGHAPQGENRLAEKVIRSIQAAGGLAVLAHPARYRRAASDLIEAGAQLGLNGVETYYAYDNPEFWRPCPKQTPNIKYLAQQLQLLTTCGTDTHGLKLTRRI